MIYTGPYQTPGPSNPLHGEAMTACALARKIYSAPVAYIITEALSWMGLHNWSGDGPKLRALIDGVRADAAKYLSEAA